MLVAADPAEKPTHAGGLVYRIRRGRLEFLLVTAKRATHLWVYPKGHVEKRETPRETAIREVAEETGIDARAHALESWNIQNVYEIYPVWRHRYAPGVTHNTEHVFGLRVPERLAVRVAPREHLRAEWLPWREAASKVFSWSNCRAIEMLGERRET